MTLVTYDRDAQKELCALLGIAGTDNHIKLLFKLAEHYQLDVLTKEIALIPRKGPFIGVWGRLHIAHRSGKLDGLELDDEWETDKHYCVRVVVWRKDMRHPAAKVVGRVGKHEGSTDKETGEFIPKDWPLEIARARGLRAALGFAFSIHDTFDSDNDAGDEWAPVPDERVTATGEVIEAAAPEEVTGGTAAAPKRRRKPTSDQASTGTETGEVNAESERDPGAGQAQQPPPPEVVPDAPAPAPGTDPHLFRGEAVTDNEPRTLIVGGHSLAQRFAIAARQAGIDDDEDRHGIIRVLTGGQYQRGTDVPEDAPQEVIDHILDGIAGIGDGSLYYRCNPDGSVRGVYKTKKP